MNWRPYTFIALLLVSTVVAIPIPTKFDEWLHGAFHPSPGGTLAEEIKCYNLPYGGIGFTSHILTYYTAIMIMLGKTPLFPRPGEHLKHSWFDIVLGIITLVATIPIAAMTMAACRNRWQFVLIGKIAIQLTWEYLYAEDYTAFLKLFLSFTACAIIFHANGEIRAKGKISISEPPVTFWWTWFYSIGAVVGLVGVISLTVPLFSENRSIRIITAVFVSLAGFPAVCAVALLTVPVLLGFVTWMWRYFLYFFRVTDEIPDFKLDKSLFNMAFGQFVAFVLFLGPLAGLYSDWILAAIAGNWTGTPSSDIAILY